MTNITSEFGDLLYKLMLLFGVAGVAFFLITLFFKKFGSEAGQRKSRVIQIQNATKYLDSERRMGFESPATSHFYQNFSRKIGLEDKLKFLIIRSGVEISESNFLLMCLVLLFISFIFGFIVGMNVVQVLILGIFVGTLPVFYLKHKGTALQERLLIQLPDALDFLIRTLQVGHGLTSIFGMMGDELPSPIKKEFQILNQEITFGLPFPVAMLNFTKRINSTDFNFLAVGLLVQRESGGNLIGLLQGLANDIRERIVFSKKVKILSTEAVYSARLLFALPFLLAGVLFLLNPEYMSILWKTESGTQIATTTLFIMCIGGLWMQNMSKIRV